MKKIKRQIKNPRLLQIRKKLIKQCLADELFSYEVAEIFRITESMVSQIKAGANKKHKK